jgi:hypothetical protein
MSPSPEGGEQLVYFSISSPFASFGSFALSFFGKLKNAARARPFPLRPWRQNKRSDRCDQASGFRAEGAEKEEELRISPDG